MDHTFTFQLVHEAEIGLVLSAGGWILMFPVRAALAKAKAFFDGFEAKFSRIETELTTQRTNCLSTLQRQGDAQIKTLERMAGTLDAMHISQAEMTGYLKGKQ